MGRLDWLIIYLVSVCSTQQLTDAGYVIDGREKQYRNVEVECQSSQVLEKHSKHEDAIYETR